MIDAIIHDVIGSVHEHARKADATTEAGIFSTGAAGQRPFGAMGSESGRDPSYA